MTGQYEKLRSLFEAVLASNPFYGAKLRAAGITAPPSTHEDFHRVPFTAKYELIDDQRANPPYGTNLTFPFHHYTRFCQTSGSTGRPLRWLDTPQSWSWMVDNWTQVYKAAGVSPGDRIFFAFSFGPFLGFWLAFEAAARCGCLSIPGGGMRSAARLAEIIDTGATVLCCTPTYAIRLAEVAQEEGIDLSSAKIHTIIVAGEPGGSIPATRSLIQSLWNGAQVLDHHGMTEVGPVSYGCPIRPGVLHIIESAYIAEVIHPITLQPVAPGATGELILTNLGRTGSPLIRYRTGDIVQLPLPEPCPCGSPDLALPGGILGRTDDMVVVRGVNVYPSAVEEVIRSCGGVAEYRVEISTSHALTELKLFVEPTPESATDSALPHRLEAALRNAFSLRIAISLVPSGSLPRFEMKSSRWTRV